MNEDKGLLGEDGPIFVSLFWVMEKAVVIPFVLIWAICWLISPLTHERPLGWSAYHAQWRNG